MAEPWQNINGGGSEPWQRRLVVPSADPQPVEQWQRVTAGVASVEPWQRVIVGATIPPAENWQLRKANNV